MIESERLAWQISRVPDRSIKRLHNSTSVHSDLPIVKEIAEVPCATPVPVFVDVAATPVTEYIAPVPPVTMSSPSQQLSPVYTMEPQLDDLIDCLSFSIERSRRADRKP